MNNGQIIAERSECWDGTTTMQVIYNDGGRADAGWKGSAGDCVVRSIAIATEQPYQAVYADLFQINKEFAETSRSRSAKLVKRSGGTPRDGNFKQAFKPYLESLGWKWFPTMGIGTGCRVHLCENELPKGRLIVRLSKHMAAIIDGVIHDTYDPQWSTLSCVNGVQRIAHRCVYGYFEKVQP